MPPGIGYSFSPSGDVPMNSGRRSGGGSLGPQEAIRMLSLRLPKAAGPSAIAPSALLNSQGGAGVPNLNSILGALVQAFAPQHQPGVPSLPALAPPSMAGRPAMPPSPFSQPSQPSPQPSLVAPPRGPAPAPRIIPGQESRAPEPFGGQVQGETLPDVGARELLDMPEPQASVSYGGLFDDDGERSPAFPALARRRMFGF